MTSRHPYRPSTLEERRKFYAEEFSLEKVKAWFKKHGMQVPQICALDAGTETGIIINKKLANILFYFPFRELEKKIKQYLPEDVYYDRNKYANFEIVLKNLRFGKPLEQELVFDIDADNIICTHNNKKEVCEKCLFLAWNSVLALKKELEKKFNKIHLIYSGRGFHVHVQNTQASKLSFSEREKLNKQLKKFPFDPWVSEGHIRLIRMPYTLHGSISRKVMPLPAQRFLSLRQTIPQFLKC